MKATLPYCLVSLIAWTSGIIAFSASNHLQAADLFWNTGGSGGDGIWGTGPGEKNWNLTSGALAGNIAWPNAVGDIAIFQDSGGGVVTLSEPLQATGIVQNGANYSINAGVITLVANSPANPVIDVKAGILTIDSVVSGSNGLIKDGVGTLTLTGANSFSGNTQIQNGTLRLVGSVASTSLSVSSGATLLNLGGGFSNGATLTNAGSFSLNVDDTVTNYISNGGTLGTGPGTLFSTSAALNSGSTLAGILNTGTLTSNGAVLLSGTATAGSASIQSGTLTLGGTLASNTVGIASGASLLNQNSGLTSGATLTNAGFVTFTVNDAVKDYVSNGGTLRGGAGTLSTTNATLNTGSTLAGRLDAHDISSNGAITMSGIVTAKDTTRIESGVLNLTGALTTANLDIASGASLVQNGSIEPSNTGAAFTVVTNAGSLIIQESTVFKTYISNGGLLDIHGGRMITRDVMLNDKSITKGGSFSANLITTNGSVLIENNALSARSIVASGVLDLVGSLSASDVEIASNASLLNQNGGLSGKSTLTNAGSLTLSADDTITSYISNGGTLGTGPGTLFSTSAVLNSGSTLAGLLNTNILTSDGAVLLSGTATAGSAVIQSGVLTLSGTLASNTVGIASGASLLNQNGGLSEGATLTNAGSLTLNVNDTVTTYLSNGGTLTAGAGTLFTTNATLNAGSTLAGLLNARTLTSDGAVLFSGTGTVGNVSIQSGTFTLSGTLLASNVIGIASGAAVINQRSGLSSNATVTNAGSLTLHTNDTITRYISNGGNLAAGAGTLFTTSTALDNGSSVTGGLYADYLVSNGIVAISGTVTGKNMTTTVESGTLDLTGTLTTSKLNILSGATLIQNGNIGPSTVGAAVTIVTNEGGLAIKESAIFKTYLSNGGLLDIQGGKMITQTVTLYNGSITKGGSLSADLITTNGAVRIENDVLGGRTILESGVLDLVGSLGVSNVEIASGASLLNKNGGLIDTATITNSGSLTLNVNDTVTSYFSNGGTLTAGAGTLFTTNAALNAGSTLAGLLNSNTLTSDGGTQVSGTISATSININTGTLTNTGVLGNVSTHININQASTLNAGGIQHYSLLTSSGAGSGTWQGDLVNTSHVAPGGLNSIGVLAVGGNFTQSAGGTLTVDLSAIDSDRLEVAGSATFNGALVLTQSGAAPIAPFVPVAIVSASGYSGNISSLSENFDGTVWFNPGNGTVTRLDFPSAGTSFSGSTRNQTATWISLYDDAIDPGISNIASGSGGYEISSGIADIGNPDLQWALAASFTPNGLNAALLNRLSPEVYGSLSDYSLQATRVHQRAAFSAPALDPRVKSGSRMGSSAKGGAKSGAKGGISDLAVPPDWEFFAALDYFQAGTDNSVNQADYDFDNMGVLVGTRTRPTDKTQLGVYFGVDSGTISGELIDADAFGWNSGMLGEYLLDEKSRTRLTAGIAYGNYTFDGDRGSASATAAGWSPGTVGFDDVDVAAFDLFLGVDGVAWKQEALTLIPSLGLRYAMSTMDSFNESTGAAPGSPIALDVKRDRYETLLLELGLLSQVKVNAKLALWGEGGVNLGLLDEDRVLTARFAKGSREMHAEADGLNDDSFYLGCGAAYQISDNIQAGLGYRVDIRSEARAQQELRLSSSWRF